MEKTTNTEKNRSVVLMPETTEVSVSYGKLTVTFRNRRRGVRTRCNNLPEVLAALRENDKEQTQAALEAYGSLLKSLAEALSTEDDHEEVIAEESQTETEGFSNPE